MGLIEDCAAGRLVHAAALHADDAVLDDVDDADAVLAAELVAGADDVGELHLLTVHRNRDALLKVDRDVGLPVRCLLRRGGQNQQVVVVGLERRILELKALVGDVPDVAVTAVGVVLGAEGKVDAMSLCIGDLGLAGVELPEGVAPCGDDLEIRCQGLDAELKADLVISLSGGTVADGDGVLLAGDLNQLLGNEGSCHGGSDQVLVLIDGVCLDAGSDVLVAELIDHVEDVELVGTAVLGSLLETGELLLLADIDADADDARPPEYARMTFSFAMVFDSPPYLPQV